MNGDAKLKAQAILPFAINGVLFGLIYNALFYPHSLVEFAEAGTIGLLLGLFSGFAERSYLKKNLDKRSFSQALIVRTVLYSLTAAISLALVLSIEPATLGKCSYSQCLISQITSSLFLRDLIFTTAIVFLMTFTAQVVLLIGTRNLNRLLMGQYRKPREIFAVFMFVDLRGSTTIAEKLGHEKFSEFLRDYFNDISRPIHNTRGEIYQYVGDEVVITWPGKLKNDRSDWYKCFKAMKAYFANKEESYKKKYGIAPEFKAGVHGGLVVVTEVGTLKKAIVYHGDVLNTAARLESLCNQSGYDLLVSEFLLNRMKSSDAKDFTLLESVLLRGKTAKTTIYGCAQRSHS